MEYVWRCMNVSWYAQKILTDDKIIQKMEPNLSGGIIMKKYRVTTTISQKHHDILKKHAEKYGTQQSTLEHALEGLENNSNQPKGLSKELKVWMRAGNEVKDILVIFQKDLGRMLIENADIEQFREYVKNVTPAMFAVEWLYNKPLKECTLQELIDGLICNIKIQSSADTITCTEDGQSYAIHMTHSFGIKGSQTLVMMNERALESYGAKFESNYSERSITFKIFK